MAGGGTKREIRPGVWELRVNVGKDPISGRYRQVSETFKGGKLAAREALARLAAKHDIQRGAKVSFRFHTEEWLARADLSPTTRARYNGLLRKWIYPVIGETQLPRLTAYQLDQLYGHMTEEGQAPASVLQAHTVIRRSLGQAVKWDRIETNPAKKASPPSRYANIRPVPPSEQLRKVLELAGEKDEDMATVIMVAATTGARRGELAALQWRHLRLEAAKVDIDQAVVNVGGGKRGRLARDDPGSLLVKSTKTHAKRSLSLDPATVEMLRRHRRRAEDRAAQFHAELTDQSFVFSREPAGRRPVNPDTLTHDFAELRDKAGVGYFSLHGLRHWTATTSLVNGQDVRTVAGRLGHKDPSVTLRVYAHFLEAPDQRMANELAGVLTSGREEEPPPADRTGALEDPAGEAGSAR